VKIFGRETFDLVIIANTYDQLASFSIGESNEFFCQPPSVLKVFLELREAVFSSCNQIGEVINMHEFQTSTDVLCL
jgi:hypothetical protein